MSTPKLPPVPRGHCRRCQRCGWSFASGLAGPNAGCSPTYCCYVGKLDGPRTTCAGCGAPYDDTEEGKQLAFAFMAGEPT